MATRRSFLAFLAAGTGTLAGCTANKAQRESADGALRARAAVSALKLAALYEAALSGASVDHAVAELYRSHHVAHAQRLTNSPNSTDPTTDAAAAIAIPTAADLAVAERTAPGAGPADVNAAIADLAALLASIATCRALHAQSLEPSTPLVPADAPPLTITRPSSGEPLQTMLSAEYAVIFAYGALGPYLRGSQLAAAHALFDLHRSQRDALMSAIGARGDSPRAGAAAYDLPFQIKDAASACRLAALVETRLAAVCAQAVSTSSGADRMYSAWALTQASLRAQTWGAPVTAFPGLA